MITSYRPASSETWRFAQSSRRQISSSMASMDGVMVGSPTHAEPLPSAVRPTRFTAAVGCRWESRTPVELPKYSVVRSSSAKPASTASRARARPKAPDSDDNTSSRTEESVSSGGRPKARPT